MIEYNGEALLAWDDVRLSFPTVRPRVLEEWITYGRVPIVSVRDDGQALFRSSDVARQVDAAEEQRRLKIAETQEVKDKIAYIGSFMGVSDQTARQLARTYKLVPDHLIPQRPRSITAKIGRDGKSWVYYLQAVDGGAIKIGKTRELSKRLNDIQHMNSAGLMLLAVEPLFMEHRFDDTEALRHYQFEAVRLHGEWFSPVPELINHIQGQCLVVNEPVGQVLLAIRLWRAERDELNERRRLKREAKAS